MVAFWLDIIDAVPPLAPNAMGESLSFARDCL
jgi:hypothetical protein